jgi:hypothetical protein
VLISSYKSGLISGKIIKGCQILQNEKDKSQLITREYALFCSGRYASQAVGEHTFYGQGNMVYGKAMEAAKSNALVRCCKDLGIASELWDPKVQRVPFA